MITLITRPRRFGKTLNMDMLKCFFSNRYAGREELFEGLAVWQEEKYRRLQGSYPVIYLTFADIKADSYEDSKNSIIAVINEAYQAHRHLLESDVITDGEKNLFKAFDEYTNDSTHRCRKRIFMDIGKNLQHLSEACLIRRLRPIHIWNVP